MAVVSEAGEEAGGCDGCHEWQQNSATVSLRATVVYSLRGDSRMIVVRHKHGKDDSKYLRRLMRNELDQQVRQVTQRSVEGVVDSLGAGVCRPWRPSVPTALPTSWHGGAPNKEVLELADDPFYDLALARGPAPIGLRPCPAGVVLGRGRNKRPILLHQQPLPLYSREAFVGQVRSLAVGGHEGFPYGPLVRGRGGQDRKL